MEYIAQIILAIIAAITTVVTVILQKKQDNLTTKIDKSSNLLKHKEDIEQQIELIELKHRNIIDTALLLILDTNLDLLVDKGINVDDRIKENIKKIHETLSDLSDKTSEIDKKYSVLLDLSKY